ncbi:DUF1963 domain-containing protein [Rubritalea halochordaticola]
MDLESLLKEIGKPCTGFEVGGFRPTNEVYESWLGKVSLYLPEEEVPIDKYGKPMMQLGQFYLPALPYVPESLAEVSLLTVFISQELEGDSDLMDGCWEIREYKSLEGLLTREFNEGWKGIKAFPLKPVLIETDHPVWDGGGLTREQEDAFIRLEGKREFDSYYDVTTHAYSHKFGGYPSFCQSGVEMEPYEFVFQISSDEKLQLNVIDGGSFTFWRHPQKRAWKLYYDFF